MNSIHSFIHDLVDFHKIYLDINLWSFQQLLKCFNKTLNAIKMLAARQKMLKKNILKIICYKRKQNYSVAMK